MWEGELIILLFLSLCSGANTAYPSKRAPSMQREGSINKITGIPRLWNYKDPLWGKRHFSLRRTVITV